MKQHLGWAYIALSGTLVAGVRDLWEGLLMLPASAALVYIIGRKVQR